MKISIYHLGLFAALMITPVKGFTQAPENELSINSGSLNDQFDYAIKKSSPYLEFRVVKEAWMLKLKQHVADSLKEASLELERANKTIAVKTNEINSIKAVLQNTNKKLDSTIKEKNSLRILGIQMNKTFYTLLMLLIMGGLAALLVFLIILFKRNLIITRQTRKDLQNLEETFKQHRTNARLREEKLARDYHYELSKYKNQS